MRMKICRICGRISATDADHTDCTQKRRIELEDEHIKEGLPDRLNMAKSQGGLGVEIRAILEHLAREKVESSKD